MESFQEELLQVDNRLNTDATISTYLGENESSELANECRAIENELSAGIPEIKDKCRTKQKVKRGNAYLNSVIKMVAHNPELLHDKSLILVIVLEILQPVIHYNKLRHLNKIDSIVSIYAEKLTDTILSGKYLSGEEYTLENIIRMVKNFAYLRARSWKKQLINQYIHSFLWASDFIYEKNEKGEVSDFGYSDKQGLNSFDNIYNGYRYSSEDISLFNIIIEKTLKKMAKKRSKNARLHFELMALDLNRTDLIKKKSILYEDKNKLPSLRCEARKVFYLTAIGYYPRKKDRQKLGQMENEISKASIENIDNSYCNVINLEINTIHNGHKNYYDAA